MIAKEGERINFVRDDKALTGIVFRVYERSVCVELDAKSAALAKVARTVVNHKRYAVKPYERTPEQYKAFIDMGWSDARIASVFGMTYASLCKFKNENGLNNTNRKRAKSIQRIESRIEVSKRLTEKRRSGS